MTLAGFYCCFEVLVFKLFDFLENHLEKLSRLFEIVIKRSEYSNSFLFETFLTLTAEGDASHRKLISIAVLKF